jgi:hypothetical protein
MELVGTAPTNDPVVHRRGSRCALAAAWESNGGVKQRQSAQELLVGVAHSCMMASKGSKGNYDPSR